MALNEDILKMCIRVDGTKVYYPLYDEYSDSPITASPEYARKYGWNNGTVAFITENGEYYVTPFCFEVRDYLEELGYKDIGLYVPFSNGDIPADKDAALVWEALRNKARKVHEEKRIEEHKEKMKSLAEEKSIQPLPEQLYELCLNIPESGLMTSWMGQNPTSTFPVSDWEVPKHMGTYCQNNGKVVFVNDEGKTFVTPYCSEVRDILDAAGYRQGSLFVPLSNGEDIVDDKLNEKWNFMVTDARNKLMARIKEENLARFKTIAEEKGVKTLPQGAYDKSLEIPQDGLETVSLMSGPFITSPVYEFQVPEHLGKYCQNNGRVVFVDEQGKTWVTPFCFEVSSMLRDAGYREGSIFVPLSNGEEIKDPVIAQRWESLCTEARKNLDARMEQRKQDKIKDVASKKDLKDIPDSLYVVTVRVPEEGLENTWLGEKREPVRPIPDYKFEELMGCYCTNNGRIIFVDKTGATHISPYAYEVAAILEACGYTRKDMFVPMSNGEEFVDPALAAKWEAMSKDSLEAAQRRFNNGGNGNADGGSGFKM
jgi:hypothetical protein